MSHETHHHADDKTKTSSTAAVWFVLVLVALFIAAVNFVNVMGHPEAEGHGAGHGTEHETYHGHEMNESTPAGHTTNDMSAPAADSAHTEGH